MLLARAIVMAMYEPRSSTYSSIPSHKCLLFERERRLLLFGVFYASVEAADAFGHGDVVMGVVHAIAAMYVLQKYWELRR